VELLDGSSRLAAAERGPWTAAHAVDLVPGSSLQWRVKERAALSHSWHLPQGGRPRLAGARLQSPTDQGPMHARALDMRRSS